jgi:hypothetical protein
VFAVLANCAHNSNIDNGKDDMSTIHAKDFAAACLSVYEFSNGSTTRTFYVSAHRGPDWWSLWLDTVNHPAHKEDVRQTVCLASTRSPGDCREFKTLDAAYNEARRMADLVGADLQLTIRN